MDMASGMEALKARLEVLLGKPPESAMDESVRHRVEQEATILSVRREKVAEAGGALLSAAFGFLSEIIPEMVEGRIYTVQYWIDLLKCWDDWSLRAAPPVDLALDARQFFRRDRHFR